jgi:hypothetical protein
VSLDLVVFLLGLFGVPVALLVLGHRVRKRSPRMQHAFLGAFVGHCIAGTLAVVWGMIPPDAWTPDETARGFAGLWSLLVFPIAGGALAAMNSKAKAIGVLAIVAASVGSIAAIQGNGSAASQQAGGALVPVIGSWATIVDGGPALKVDGEKWSGVTTRAQVEAAMRPFFGTVGDTLVANGTSPGAFPLAIWNGASNFTSGTVRVQFKMNGGKTDQNAGIVLGLQPNGEYLYVRYNTKDGDVAVWRFEEGERVRVVHGTTHANLPLDQWHTLTVRVTGNKVVGAVSDSVTVEHTLERPLSGRLGVWVKRDAITTFRGFRVSP